MNNFLLGLNFLLIYLLFSVGCSISELKEIENIRERCYFPTIKVVDLYQLESQLIGKWKYQFSKKKDSCFVKTDFFIPRKLLFRYCSPSTNRLLEKEKPKIYALKKINGFDNICSVSTKDSTMVTYPFYPKKKKSQVRQIHIFHYQSHELGSVGKDLMYTLDYLDKDTLIISDNFSASFDKKHKKDTYHFLQRINKE